MKIRLPLLSDRARGKVSESFVFSSWKGRPYARRYVKPHDPHTEKQTAWRSLFKEAVQAYRELCGEEKNKLNRKAARLKITGLNLFMREFMKARNESKT